MNGTKKSLLAQFILDNAEEYRSLNNLKALSSELVFAQAVAFCTMSAERNSAIDAEEYDRLCSVIDGCCDDKAYVMNALLSYVKTDETPAYMNALNFNTVLFVATEKSGDMLRADVLIQCIIDSSAKGIKRFVVDGEKADLPEEKKEPVSLENLTGGEKIKKLTKRTKEIRNTLLESIFGQDNAIDVFATGYFRAELLAMTDKTRFRPKATYLFAGPPGVGKTFLAEKSAEVLKLPFMRFDMSEYSDDEANIEFCGSDKVYKNGKEGNVTKFVSENPGCILLFDEIEKAHINIIHLFLQILDAGRLRDNYTDTEVSFKDVIIIFTTNAGKKLYENSESGNYSGISRKVILKALEGDKNPATGISYFPAAICSRFGSGNVVMFNHIEAHSLRTITKKEILRRSADMEAEFQIKSEFDERVFSALMFAEGGAADARTVRSRAEAFYDNELFELFRLVDSEKTPGSIDGIETVKFSVKLPEDNDEIVRLFESTQKSDALVFACENVTKKFKALSEKFNIITADDVDGAEKLLKSKDFEFVLCDVCCGRCDINEQNLNVEDIDSAGTDFFKLVRENYMDLPVYLLETGAYAFSKEEKFSFTKQGARDVINIENEELFCKAINEIGDNIYQQHSMRKLARANKVVEFETSQSISPDGKCAEITLYDFEMSTAIDPDDSKNILSNLSKPDVRFEHIIGANDAKEELRYFTEYLKNPKKFSSTGVRAPRGVLLYGPPGTGKTMLAKAMAVESNVTFITAEGNHFLKKYVGEGSETVHNLFSTARKYAPSILFIDEIDAIAKERKGGKESEGSEDTLTAFLAEMDGFKNDTSKPVFVLAATNFNVEPGTDKSLDSALMRRFDRKVYIDLPDKQSRIVYLKNKLASNPIFDVSEEKLENIAVRSVGMSLAELESVNELAIRASIRQESQYVTDAIYEEAFETYNGGESKKWDETQVLRVARHEAGHTLICCLSGDKPSYVTVVSRGNHGGYMQHGDNEGKAVYTKEELLSKIRISLGGRASEIVYYGEKDGISTGASGDLESATALATDMICRYGMVDSIGLATVNADFASQTEKIRDAVNEILNKQMSEAIRLISENQETIDMLVDALVKKNNLSANEIDAILNS